MSHLLVHGSSIELRFDSNFQLKTSVKQILAFNQCRAVFFKALPNCLAQWWASTSTYDHHANRLTDANIQIYIDWVMTIWCPTGEFGLHVQPFAKLLDHSKPETLLLEWDRQWAKRARTRSPALTLHIPHWKAIQYNG